MMLIDFPLLALEILGIVLEINGLVVVVVFCFHIVLWNISSFLFSMPVSGLINQVINLTLIGFLSISLTHVESWLYNGHSNMAMVYFGNIQHSSVYIRKSLHRF